MRRRIAREFPKHFGKDWLDRVIQDWPKLRRRVGGEVEVERLTLHRRHVADGRAESEEFFEARHFRALVEGYADAFPPMLVSHSHMLDSVRESRNVTEHGSHLSESTSAQQALITCRAVLAYAKDQDAVNEIERLQSQLNDLDSEDAPGFTGQDEEPRDAQPEDEASLAEQDGEPRDAQPEDEASLAEQDGEPRDAQPEDGASLAEQNGEPRDAQPEDGASLAEQDGEPRDAQPEDGVSLAEQDGEPHDAQPEDGASLAEQDGEPPARRAEGGGLSRRFYSVLVALVIAAIAALLLLLLSGNGSPVCNDIDDVELRGPGGSTELAALGDYCTDSDEDELAFSAASSDNGVVSATVAGDSLTLIAGGGDGGTATITVTATDPDGRSATASFDVTVNPPPPPPNQPPVCDDVEDITIVVDGEREVSISCSDPDGDMIVLRVGVDSQTDHFSVSPDTASINGSGTRQFTITGLSPTGLSPSAGANYVEIEADDGKGGTSRVRFNVAVEDLPPVEPQETEGELESDGSGQTESLPGDGAATDDDSPTTVRGYVIARVHPLPEKDRRGSYRIEFGFLSSEVLASGTDRTAVVEANKHLLPPRRHVDEALMLDRARDNNRNWLRSSPIDVFPFGGDDATLSGEPLLTGRVIARWSPTSGGQFRVELGFLPEWAFQEAGGDAQRAVELYANLLPNPARYLTESQINSEADRNEPRWLTSSLVTIGRPVTNGR